MDTGEISDGLRKLARNSAKRSKSALFRELFPDIEVALNSGVPQSEVIQELEKKGLVLSILTFRNYLHKSRLKNKSVAIPMQEAGLKKAPKPIFNNVSDSSAIQKIAGISQNKPDLDAYSKFSKKGK